MTTPAKPLTSDEVAAKRRQIECDVCETRLGLYRLTDTQRRTIEQQAEQIEKLTTERDQAKASLAMLRSGIDAAVAGRIKD